MARSRRWTLFDNTPTAYGLSIFDWAVLKLHLLSFSTGDVGEGLIYDEKNALFEFYF